MNYYVRLASFPLAIVLFANISSSQGPSLNPATGQLNNAYPAPYQIRAFGAGFEANHPFQFCRMVGYKVVLGNYAGNSQHQWSSIALDMMSNGFLRAHGYA